MTALALLALVAGIYGGRLGIGYLSDDFLYLSWWQEGWGELLRKVTVDSNPRMIRPLPALAWSLSALPGGAILYHGISLVLHTSCGWLVARLVRRSGGSAEAGGWAGALFLCFPLFTEPVLWLSAAPDLWACAGALAALEVGLGRGRWAPWIAAGLFGLSLLSKESTLPLPLVALCVAPGHRARRLAAALGAVAGLYLLWRWTLFGGIGGYLDADGRSSALAIDPLRVLRNVTLQLPYRLLVPLKRAGDLAPWLALLTAGLALAACLAIQPWRRVRPILLGVLAFGFALGPVMAYFAIDQDHENARLLYFPLAAFAAIAGATLGSAVPDTEPLSGAAAGSVQARRILGFWVVFWSLVSIANGAPWSAGATEIRQTLAAMREAQDRYPSGATVLIDGHDTWRGAYVWRNGLAFAARRAGLRDDVHWTLGSAALVARPEPFGRTIFGLGVDIAGRPRDWTHCQQRLLTTTLDVLGRAVPRPVAARLETGPIALSRATRFPALVIVASAPPPPSGLAGQIYWRQPGGSRFDLLGLSRPRFNATEVRRFRVFAGPADRTARSIVRLPATSRPLTAIDVRLDLDAAGPGDALSEVLVAEAPSACHETEGPLLPTGGDTIPPNNG